MTNTTNYNLAKPADNETADIGVISDDMDKIDAALLPENNLTSTDTKKALAAAQGKVLDGKITTLNESLSGVTNKGYAITADATEDLNNLKSNGKYGVNGATVANCPDNTNSFMVDITAIETSYVIQEASPWWNPNTIRYRRVYNNGTWTAWKLIAITETLALALLNSWTEKTSDNVTRVSRSGNVCTLNMRITGGLTTANTIIATLPTGMIPSKIIVTHAHDALSGAYLGALIIVNDGNIRIFPSALTNNSDVLIEASYSLV